METRISHSFNFGAGGNSTQIQVSGWSVVEPEHTWSVGYRSIVVIDDLAAPHGFFLELDWQPFVAYPYRADQAVLITVGNHRISPYRVAQRETAAFFCPPPSAAEKKMVITFEHPDTSKISDYLVTTDTREVAIAYRRLRILPLTGPAPIRVNNNDASKVKIHDGQVIVSDEGDKHRIGLSHLLSQFELLAGNCDLGLSMRTLGFERLSLLRFAGATAEVAIRGLENDFQGIGEELTAEIADNPIKEWMIRDAFGLRFHTHQSSEVMSTDAILKRQRLHIGFLRRKFLEDVQLGEKIFVYSDHHRPRTFESALALFLALNRRGRHRMLWVCPNFEEIAPGRVDEILPGFARGSLDRFAGPPEAGHIAVHGWVHVLFNAFRVLSRAATEGRQERAVVNRQDAES